MLQLLMSKFKNSNGQGDETAANKAPSANLDSWYKERYESILTQRNLLALLTVVSFLAVVAAILVVGKVSTSKSFSPFVIQIEERTGSAKVVNPVNSNLLSGNEALARYFIKKYLIARETYNPIDFENNVRKVVRLYSTPEIYRDFIGIIRNPLNDPTILYGQKNTTYLRVKSFSRLADKYFVRYSIIEYS